MEVELTVTLIRKKRFNTPRVESDSHIMAVGLGGSLEDSLKAATSGMAQWLEQDYGLDTVSASTLLGQAVEYDLGNVYDPAYTMVCKLRKSLLPQGA